MANRKGTKRTLLTSALSLLLCISMLISTTFAWFTDKVTTKGNVIQTGVLDLEMYWAEDPINGPWYNVEEEGYNTIFSYENWEPGYTDVKYIKLVNNGNLALNYDLSLAPQGAAGKLAEVINVYYAINDDKLALRTDLDQLSCIGLLNNVMNGGSTASGTLLPAGTTSLFHDSGEVILTVGMEMVTSAGNEYQGESTGDFTIKALATQAPWESDSFGSNYDSGAELPYVLTASKITVPVTPVDGKIGTEGLSIVGTSAAAYLPEGVKLVDGATEVTLNITPKDSSESGLSVVNDEILIPVDVHVDGVAEDNTVPIIIDLGQVLPKYLNMGNYKLVHVEDGVNQIMDQVANRNLLTQHNQFTYNSNTGAVSVCMATFSEVAALADTENKWQGGVDYSWFVNWTKTDANDNRRTYTLTNADQLYGFAKIVGGMHIQDTKWTDLLQDKDPANYDGRGNIYVDDNGVNILSMGFNGHTVQLLNNVDLGGTDVKDVDGKKRMFYPIGYYNNTNEDTTTPVIYDREDGTVVGLEGVNSNFKAFRGTFNGNGHTISNLYQNTWEMFGDYNNGYSGTPNYYKDGMGLFGWLYGATIYNTNVDNFESDGEFTPTGVIAAYAEAAQQDADAEKGVLQDWGATTIEGVSITNCNPRVYNTGNGGIVGIGGRDGNQYIAGDNKGKECRLIFRKITVDGSNKISALWGSWDVACGGIMGMFRGNGRVDFSNCSVSAQIDVFNDVCGNYQYYWYRYAGMIIGSIRGRNITNEDGYVVPDMTGIHASNCTVQFDKWNDYYYCELVANSLASYTHDHQFSRLELINSVDAIKTDGEWSKAGNFLTIAEDGTKICYHIVKDDAGNLVQHKHEDAGTETVNGVAGVLKEDKQIVYLPFDQLFQGDGWGVKNVAICDLDNYPDLKDQITILKKDDLSKAKFTANYGTSAEDPMLVGAGATLTVGDLFSAIDESAIRSTSVGVFVEKIKDGQVYERIVVASSETIDNKTVTIPWAERQIPLSEEGDVLYQINIQDYDYCLPTYIYLKAVDETVTAACAHCEDNAEATFTAWYPGAQTGHYYLPAERYNAPVNAAADADIALLLQNGKNVDFSGAAVNATDGATISLVGGGTITGTGDGEGLLKANGGNLKLYSGIYGYSGTSSDKGIIWASTPETDDEHVETNVYLNSAVTLNDGNIYLSAHSLMTMDGDFNVDGVCYISKITLVSNALLNVDKMHGSTADGKEITVTANGIFTEQISGHTDPNFMQNFKNFFKAAEGYEDIDGFGGKYLQTRPDRKATITAAYAKADKIKAIQEDSAQLSALIAGNTCPMCGAENVNWVSYATWAETAKSDSYLLSEDKNIHVYIGNGNYTHGNLIGARAGSSTMCIVLNNATVTTKGRLLANPGNTMNIMGKGSIASTGSSALGLFTILGDNVTLNLYGGTYTYTGDYDGNGKTTDPDYTLLNAHGAGSTVNIYNDVVIGDAEQTTRTNYNLVIGGTLNMYGGTIQNGLSAHPWMSGNVTLREHSNFNMYDGKIIGGVTPFRGGNVLIRSYVTMNMGYHTAIDNVTMNPEISGGLAKYENETFYAGIEATRKAQDPNEVVSRVPGGGNVGTRESVGYVSFNMYNGTIKDGVVDVSAATEYKPYMGGGNFYMNGRAGNKVTLTGGTITNGNAHVGGNIYIRNGVKMYLEDGMTVSGGKAALSGGNINLFHFAEMYMSGGVVTNGVAGARGGNINVGYYVFNEEKSILQITGGEITGGVAGTNAAAAADTEAGTEDDTSTEDTSGTKAQPGAGGNICSLYADMLIEGSVTITGGQVLASANNNYRNIYFASYEESEEAANLTLKDVTLQGAIAVRQSAHTEDGVTTLYAKPTVTLIGKVTIESYSETEKYGMQLCCLNDSDNNNEISRVVLDISQLSADSMIMIDQPDGMEGAFTVASDNAAAVQGCFQHTTGTCAVELEDNVLKLVQK